MAVSNLRPLSAACSLLIGAAQGKDEADRDVKQREWIWEFFLKHNANGRLLLELMTALPFPNENVYLKRLLLLRSLSFQSSCGLYDELTLDILKALGEIGWKPKGCLAGIDCSEASGQPAKKRMKQDETKISNPEATRVSAKRGLPETLIGKKSLRSRSKEGLGEEKGPDVNHGEKVFPNEVLTGLKDTGLGNKFSCPQGQASHWELQLAVMVELTVKHLRGASLSKKSFEGALRKYWGDIIMDTEEPVVEKLAFDRAREEIRNELWKVYNNLDFLDEITHKYTEERVRNLLASFLSEAWADTEESFLEKVSSHVVNGTYEPLNPDVQRRNVGGIAGEDGAAVNRRELMSEKPVVRSSRGKFSRSREKLQKTFGVFEINARREVENAVNLVDGGAREKSTEDVRTSKIMDILGPPLLQTRTADESLQSARDTSHGIRKKNPIINVETDEPVVDEFDHEETGKSQPCDRVLFRTVGYGAQDGGLPCKEKTCDGFAEDLRNVNISPSTNTCGDVDPSREDRRKGKGLCFVDQESSEEARDRAKSTDVQGADSLSPNSERAGVEIVNLSSPSPQPLAEIQGSLSPPPWVASSLRNRRELPPDLTENGSAGPVEVDAGNTRLGESSRAGSATESFAPDIAEKSRKEGNLQPQPEVVVQDPLPKMQEPARVQPSLMRRNSTARTFEWDEDDISESPPSPPESRRVAIDRTSPLIASRKTSSQASTQRRKPRKWSTEETELLKNEVFKYGKGRWKLILAKNQTVFYSRTEVDLKDKWRNLERFEGLSVRDE